MGRSAAAYPLSKASLPQESWPGARADDTRWCHALRVVASRHFARSPLLSKFLLHIVAEAIEERAGEITEHQIGVRVFGRPPSYRTVEDNIVRNYARQLRRRLSDYYADEGAGEETRIDIPLGGYIPVFEPASPGPQDLEAAQPTAEEAAPPDLPVPVRSGLFPAADWKRRLIALSLLVLYSCALVVLAGFAANRLRIGIQAQRSSSPAAPLWTALFGGSAMTYIVPADAGLNLLEDVSHRPMTLADYMKGSYFQLPLPGLDTHSAEDLRSQEFTSVVDLQTITALERLPEFNPTRAMVRFPRDLHLDDLKRSNAIILGSEGSNPWAAIAEESANFHIVDQDTMEGSIIVNEKPRQGEAVSWASHWNEPAHATFAVIEYLPNLAGSGHLLLLQGLDVAGTQAAAETLFHPAAIAPILRRATNPDGSLRSFEILLRATSLQSNAMGTQVIASRIH